MRKTPLPLAAVLREGSLDGVEAVAELKRSAYYDPLMSAFARLRTEILYQGGVHGQDHVERVMLLGAIIAMQQGFTPRETELLLIACSYHDIGRIDDSRDDLHGKRSADALPALFPGLEAKELRCLQAAIATHSTKDTLLDSKAAEYKVDAESMDLCRLLCKGLKDADNLDRVRLRDLDIRHLRFDESKRMKQTAEEIYRIYRG